MGHLICSESHYCLSPFLIEWSVMPCERCVVQCVVLWQGEAYHRLELCPLRQPVMISTWLQLSGTCLPTRASCQEILAWEEDRYDVEVTPEDFEFLY